MLSSINPSTIRPTIFVNPERNSDLERLKASLKDNGFVVFSPYNTKELPSKKYPQDLMTIIKDWADFNKKNFGKLLIS